MKLITWNVQWCCGMDGVVDAARIARTARDLADFDVLCLQEVAIAFPALTGSRGEDQFALLCAALPGYRGLFAAGVDVDDGSGRRSQFGNAIFTRLPAIQAFRHLLPWPAEAAVPSMQRCALEAVVAGTRGPLRIVTTHLEYYSTMQRIAQVHALRTLHREACAQAATPRVDEAQAAGPFAPRPRPAATILCGDFNFRADSIAYDLLTAPAGAGVAALKDAWRVARPGQSQPPTFRVFDPAWSPYCCDFVFVTEEVAGRVSRVAVDATSRASDHQAVVVELDG